MKKILLMLVMAIIGLTATAQVEQGFRMGVRVNVGMSTVFGDNDSPTFGYGAGWIAEYNFTPKFYIESGINFENITHKETYNYPNYYLEQNYNAFYAQLPIHAGYRFEVGDNYIFLQAGPTLGCGLFGSKFTFDNGRTKDYFDYAKRFDLAVGGRVGYEFSKFKVSVGANYGVLSCYDIGGHTFTANASFAYMF